MHGTSGRGGKALTEQESRTLFDTYFNYVYAIVYRILHENGSREDIEECVADVFADVMQNRGNIRSTSLKSYIAAAAHNKAVNASRMLSRRSQHVVPMEDVSFGELPAPQDIPEDAEQKEMTHKLLQCIKALGEPDSAIIIQKFYLERNSVQIGQALHMNPVTVRRRMKRALERLKTMLADWDITR